MTDQELKELVASLAIAQQETDKQIKELRVSQQDTDKQQKQTDKQIKELGKQIGGLANKFGSFTEGLALPSMEKVLIERFGMECIAPRVLRRSQGEEVEYDVLAYANGKAPKACLVEIKSHLTQKEWERSLKKFHKFHQLFPEHADKQAIGIIVAVDVSKEMRRKVWETGVYLARVDEETFQLDALPDQFQPNLF